MTSRRTLASVAEGLARSFAPRNNDVEGWWALGLLLAAVPAADPEYRVDLLTGDATPALERTELSTLGDAWARYLRWSVDRHGVPIAAVRSATLTVRFDRSHVVASLFPGGPDYSFVCSVTIEDAAIMNGSRRGIAAGRAISSTRTPICDPAVPPAHTIQAACLSGWITVRHFLVTLRDTE